MSAVQTQKTISQHRRDISLFYSNIQIRRRKEVMQLTPYKCLQVLYVFLLSVPGALVFFLMVNIMRFLAPDLAFREDRNN